MYGCLLVCQWWCIDVYICVSVAMYWCLHLCVSVTMYWCLGVWSVTMYWCLGVCVSDDVLMSTCMCVFRNITILFLPLPRHAMICFPFKERTIVKWNCGFVCEQGAICCGFQVAAKQGKRTGAVLEVCDVCKRGHEWCDWWHESMAVLQAETKIPHEPF